MSEVVRYAYVQARLQTRHGMLPDEAGWRRLEATSSLTHFLNELRATPLRPWVQNIAPHSGVHQTEDLLRQLFRDQVDQVARWHPPVWQPAFRWSARLADLPALAHLLSRAELPHWMRKDAVLRPFAIDLLPLRIQALSNSPFAPLLQAWERGTGLTRAWTEQWQRLWPDHRQAAPLHRLASLLHQQHEALLTGGVADSRMARAQLAAALGRMFRRHSHQPAAGFLHLALVGVHLERLRGNLVRLALFTPKAGEAA